MTSIVVEPPSLGLASVPQFDGQRSDLPPPKVNAIFTASKSCQPPLARHLHGCASHVISCIEINSSWEDILGSTISSHR